MGCYIQFIFSIFSSYFPLDLDVSSGCPIPQIYCHSSFSVLPMTVAVLIFTGTRFISTPSFFLPQCFSLFHFSKCLLFYRYYILHFAKGIKYQFRSLPPVLIENHFQNYIFFFIYEMMNQYSFLAMILRLLTMFFYLLCVKVNSTED